MHTLAIILAVWPLAAVLAGLALGPLFHNPLDDAARDDRDVQGFAHGHLSTSQVR